MTKIECLVQYSALDVWYVGAAKYDQTYSADYQSVALGNPHYTGYHKVTAP